MQIFLAPSTNNCCCCACLSICHTALGGIYGTSEAYRYGFPGTKKMQSLLLSIYIHDDVPVSIYQVYYLRRIQQYGSIGPGFVLSTDTPAEVITGHTARGTYAIPDMVRKKYSDIHTIPVQRAWRGHSLQTKLIHKAFYTSQHHPQFCLDAWL